MIEKYLAYASDYKPENKDLVVSKLEHSLRVYELSKSFAEYSRFGEDEVELAGKIGLLHDIGKFEQIRKYGVLKPINDFDHGKCGAKMLFEDGLIEEYESNVDLYPLIKFAIENHNKYALPANSDEKILRFSKLLRDADKVDIMYQMGPRGKTLEDIEEATISPEVLSAFDKKEVVKDEDIKNVADIIAKRFSFAFDLNYSASLKPFRDHLKEYYGRVKHYKCFDEIYEKVIDYLNERIDIEC